jgi:tetratricopeptide (TPR) repeat protein
MRLAQTTLLLSILLLPTLSLSLPLSPFPLPAFFELTHSQLPPLPIDDDDESLSPTPLPPEPPAPKVEVPDKPPADLEVFSTSLGKQAELRNAEGLRYHEQGDYPRALSALRAAYDLSPDSTEIVNNLAYLLHRLGSRDEAIRFYRLALELDPNRYSAHINLVDLLMELDSNEETLSEAARLLVKARELSGNKPSVLLRQARTAARRGRFHEAELFYKEYSMQKDLNDKRRIEIGDFYQDFNRTGIAKRYYSEVTGQGPVADLAKQRLWKLKLERTARRFGWRGKLTEIPARARELVARARIQLQRNAYEEARRLLEEAIEVAPHYADARLVLGDVHHHSNQPDQAELTYLRALGLDARNAHIQTRLGELYLQAWGRQRGAEAMLYFDTALQLRPDWTTVHLRMAKACQAAGELTRALHHTNLYLANHPEADDHRDAELLRAALQAVLERQPETPSTTHSHPASGLTGSALDAVGLARAYLAEDRPEAALVQLQTLNEADKSAEVIALEGQILLAVGQPLEAIRKFQLALTLEPAMNDIREVLAAALEHEGLPAQALEMYQEAETHGSHHAAFHIIRLHLEETTDLEDRLHDLLHPGTLVHYREVLDTYLANGPDVLFYMDARNLRDIVEQRLYSMAFSLALLVLLLGGILVFILYRQRRGVSLETMLVSHPETSPDIQRILAAIRHEVLKHNTMMMSGLISRLERGEEATAEAAYLRDTLFGAQGDDAAYGQLLHYCRQLEQIGRSHGLYLNLTRKDETLRTVLNGFANLRKIARNLDRVDLLSDFQRQRLVKALKEASRDINETGYRAIMDLLERLRVLAVDKAFLGSILRRIRREPKLAQVPVAEPVWALACSVPTGVSIPRPALEEILGNLIRNAILASLESNTEPIQIGLGLSLDIDSITGLESVVFHIFDRSPKLLTTEMIRGRFIEGGLGMSADLVARYNGSIDVQVAAPPWTKSVIVTLPHAELT